MTYGIHKGCLPKQGELMRSRGANGGRGVEKIEETICDRDSQGTCQLLSSSTLDWVRILKQEHQFEWYSLIHPAQCLEQRDFPG